MNKNEKIDIDAKSKEDVEKVKYLFVTKDEYKGEPRCSQLV